MFEYDAENSKLIGTHGTLEIPPDDRSLVKLAMLLQGECSNVGPIQAARNFNYSKARYYQLLEAFAQKGIEALIDRKRGPKHNYRRTPEVTKLVIRLRFLDPKASPEVIASKLRQQMLGKLRRALDHYPGKVLAIDPHRVKSYSKRQMVLGKNNSKSKPTKQLQTFFVFDADSQQPICFTIGSSSRTVTQATPELLDMSEEILHPHPLSPLVLADTEHYTVKLLEHVRSNSNFDLLVPMPQSKGLVRELEAMPSEEFTEHWPGYATLKRPYQPTTSKGEPYWQTAQRLGEGEGNCSFNAFLCTSQHPALGNPVWHYPKRWHCEEFFNAHQQLGWNRAGTFNLNIRYGHMAMALIAQASLHMLRKRIGAPVDGWDAQHLADDFLHGLEGDVRLHKDTIIVTYYNAPNVDRLQKHYMNLPQKLMQEGVNPRMPWLFGYKLDFRFR